MTKEKGRQAPPAGEDVRARLLSGASALFARKGYAATSVREIVEAAGVTKPVLYYYFASKEGLYLELMGAPKARFLAMVEASLASGGDASARIRALLLNGYDLFLANRDVARVGYAIYFGPPQGAPFFDFDDFQLRLHDAIRRLVCDGIEAGEFRDGDAEAMSLSVFAVQNLAAQIELSSTGIALGREGIGRMLDVLFEGMRKRQKGKEKGKRR